MGSSIKNRQSQPSLNHFLTHSLKKLSYQQIKKMRETCTEGVTAALSVGVLRSLINVN